MEIRSPMAVLLPAVEHVVAQGQRPVAVDDAVGGDDLLLQAGHRHDDFKGGTRGILALQGPVFQGMFFILQEPLPFLGGQPPFKGLLGKAGRRGQGQDPAGAGSRATMAPTMPSRQASASFCRRLSRVR